MNRWTGTGHLTKDPKFLETDSGKAICTLRIAVKRAGKQGQDGYFDVNVQDLSQQLDEDSALAGPTLDYPPSEATGYSKNWDFAEAFREFRRAVRRTV